MNSIVTLEEVKQGLRIDEDYEDSFIESITIPAAHCVAHGRAYTNSTARYPWKSRTPSSCSAARC